MKKIFIPSMDELYQMQDRGANIYKYILVKTIEKIVIEGQKHPEKRIFNSEYNFLAEDPEIARAICSMYPEEMLYSEFARNDVDLALKLMEDEEDKKCSLDHLAKFDKNLLTNIVVLKNAILKLEQVLIKNPKYRFEYAEPNFHYEKLGAGCLLEDIFGRRLGDNELMLLLGEAREKVIKALANIEPAYVVGLPIDYFNNRFYNKNEYIRNEYLHRGIASYANRYGISDNAGAEYYGKDILTNPDENVKTLIKVIKNECN